MNELDKFCPPPRLTATPRQVERVTDSACEQLSAVVFMRGRHDAAHHGTERRSRKPRLRLAG
jgi:hypothetical protein